MSTDRYARDPPCRQPISANDFKVLQKQMRVHCHQNAWTIPTKEASNSTHNLAIAYTRLLMQFSTASRLSDGGNDACGSIEDKQSIRKGDDD